LAEE
jgi:hypothetical protein